MFIAVSSQLTLTAQGTLPALGSSAQPSMVGEAAVSLAGQHPSEVLGAEILDDPTSITVRY